MIATKHLQHAVKCEPHNVGALVQLAILHSLKVEDLASLRLLRSALYANSSSIPVFAVVAEILRMSGQHEKA